MEYEEQFERDFMKRTQSLLREYDERAGPYDATLLVNCLLGMLVVPTETFIEKIPTDPISDLKKWGISHSSIKSVGKRTPNNPHPDTLRGVVWNLRNAVAHFGVTPLHQRGECIGFEFRDDMAGFTAEISLGELRQFVEKLAEHLERKLAA
ncbi:MAG: hypothetical protein IH830_10845 [Planctomycetes bacterium]|nr:hypothetical protein [Planctomycetota bacterium]